MKLLIITLLCIIILMPSVSAYKAEQRIDIVNVKQTTSSTGWTPPSTSSKGIIEINLSKYDGITEIYFEGDADYDFNGIPNGFGYGLVALYDITNGNLIPESIVYAPGSFSYFRSDNITYLFENSSIQIMTQLRAGTDSDVSLTIARLVIVQENFNNTRTYIPIGEAASSATLCGGSLYPEVAQPHRWNYSESHFDESATLTFDYGATMRSTSSGKEARVTLRNTTINLATLSTTSNHVDYYSTSGISDPDDDEITIGICRYGFGFPAWNSEVWNAFLIVNQENINYSNPKTLSIYQLDNVERTTSLNYPYIDTEQYMAFNQTNVVGLNYVLGANFMLKQSGAGNYVLGNIRNGATGNQIFDNVSVLSTTYKYVETYNITEPPTNLGIISELWDNASGGLSYMSSSRIYILIDGIQEEEADCWTYFEDKQMLFIPLGCTFIGGIFV